MSCLLGHRCVIIWINRFCGLLPVTVYSFDSFEKKHGVDGTNRCQNTAHSLTFWTDKLCSYVKSLRIEIDLIAYIYHQKLSSLFRNQWNHIFIRYNMRKPNTLRNMSSAHTPNHSVLEGLLHGPMDLVADIFDGGVLSHNQGFWKVWFFSFPV